MDTYSSGEDLVVKTRKPYTITKQRERWSEEEHNRFLEALKLHGRAWQRIEEHIGTKTAVQIRSHAQKFFSKLEKEALVKGIPVGQAIDIEIPPPRPKRKPSNPYPRKNGAVNGPTTQVGAKDVKQGTSGSSHPGKQVLDLEKEPLPEKSFVDGGTEDMHENYGNDLCSEFTIYQEASPTFASPPNKSSGKSKADAKDPCNFTEFMPLGKNAVVGDKSSDSHMTDGPRGSYKFSEAVAMDVLRDIGTENEMQGAKNFPRHVPVHILDGNARTCSQPLTSDISYQESVYQQMHPALFTNPVISPTTESPASTSRSHIHQKLASFHPPFHPFNGTREDYTSLLQMSSAFSNLIVSTLLQNPAAHAAAIFAASFWSCTNAETSNNPHHGANGGFPPKPINPTPSMAAISAATVAAATAWWAAHGLLPVCAPPYHAGFTCPPATTVTTTHNTCQPAAVNKETEENNNNQNCSSPEQQRDQEFSEALQAQKSASDSGDQSGSKVNNVLTPSDHEKVNPAATEQKDSSNNKNTKLVDRSSCGSNSSSEVEADALEKHEQDKEESKQSDDDQAAGESCSRRSRNSSCSNDSWKEVSNVGRMAFQALFLREILPQSFSPPHDSKNEEDDTKKDEDQSNEGTSQLDLNSNIMESCTSHHETVKNNRMAEDIEARERLLTLGLAQGKLKARGTGFKPYKRCSMEASRESRMANTNSQDQEKGPKRIRLGEEAPS